MSLPQSACRNVKRGADERVAAGPSQDVPPPWRKLANTHSSIAVTFISRIAVTLRWIFLYKLEGRIGLALVFG